MTDKRKATQNGGNRPGGGRRERARIETSAGGVIVLDVPVTLRLRFLIRGEDGTWQTVTLAPISIPIEPGKKRIDQDGQPQIMEVTRSGFSHAIRVTRGKISDVRREGSARFGFGLAGLGQSTSD